MSEDRRVSIVVLTHNNLAFTKECFDALAQTTDGYELVVVDNASTDGTVEYLGELDTVHPGAKVILNSGNAGFARGCNQGVEASSGDYVCLLNNDTVPFEGWLDALLDAFDEADDVGIVGAKLLLANGKLQHCGIEFQFRAQPVPHYWPYHRYLNERADKPEANRKEDVPAVTAACLLTTRAIWDRVRGMDEGYTVANFEDVDFNLKVRSRGYRVVYQPKAVLRHYWGTTVNAKKGDADSPGLYFERNYQRLMAKWNEKLAAGLASA